jgi:dipeptidyl aminopeptidase/acylaminoacyl peptidase
VFAASKSGVLGYVPGAVAARQRSLAILRPDGRIESWSDARSAFEGPPARSPDGRFAVVTDVPAGGSLYQVVLLERGRAGTRRIAFAEGEDCRSARFSPDGREVAWVRQGVDSTDGLYLSRLDGSAPPRMVLPAHSLAEGEESPEWYPDGRSILVRSRIPQGRRILRRVTLAGDSVTVTDVVRESYDVDNGAISPDGTRIAYSSDESGQTRVVVAPLRADGRAGDAVPVSHAQGDFVRWADNTTLLWGTRERTVMAARVSPALEVGAPEKRFDLAPWVIEGGDFTPMPDGSLLITRKADGEQEIRQFDLVLGFGSELERTLRKAQGAGR